MAKRKAFKRHPKNPFRDDSSYGRCFDILAAHGKKGLHRQELIRLLAKETGKTPIRASYDARVVCSATKNHRHKSCRDGFIVEKKNDHLRLVIPVK